jgi:hypothetical protein
MVHNGITCFPRWQAATSTRSTPMLRADMTRRSCPAAGSASPTISASARDRASNRSTPTPAGRGRALGAGDRRRGQRATRALFARETPRRCSRSARRAQAAHQDDRPVQHQGEERHRCRRRWSTDFGGEVPADREALQSAARRRPQDRQCGDERRLRRADHRGRHPHLPRRQPHRPGAGQDPLEVEQKLER